MKVLLNICYCFVCLFPNLCNHIATSPNHIYSNKSPLLPITILPTSQGPPHKNRASYRHHQPGDQGGIHKSVIWKNNSYIMVVYIFLPPISSTFFFTATSVFMKFCYHFHQTRYHYTEGVLFAIGYIGQSHPRKASNDWIMAMPIPSQTINTPITFSHLPTTTLPIGRVPSKNRTPYRHHELGKQRRYSYVKTERAACL